MINFDTVSPEDITKAVPATVTPIALFVFKRTEHTLRTLQALAVNPQFYECPLYIFCDGARRETEAATVEATREVVRNFPHPNKFIVEREKNLGLAKSVIDGVTRLCTEYGRAVVMEDDLVVAPGFLGFMISALDRYRNEPDVMQVSGHQFAVDSFSENDPALFLPFVSSWGWATWDRAWKQFDANATGWECLLNNRKMRKQFDIGGAYPYSSMLFGQMQGKLDSWAIRWNWSVFKAQGRVVYPPVSYVENIGFDGSGTHCADNAGFEGQILAKEETERFPTLDTDLDVYRDPRFFKIQDAIKKMQGPAWRRGAKTAVWTAKRLSYRILGKASF